MEEIQMAALLLKTFGWTGVALYGLVKYVYPWGRDKIASQRLALARNYAKEAVQWALSHVEDWTLAPREVLEKAALDHMRFIATGPIKTWVDKDLLGSLHDVWPEVEAETRVAAKSIHESLAAADKAVARLRATIAATPTMSEQLDKLRGPPP